MSTSDAAAWPRLDKKARVGNRLFGAGVSSRHVVEAAQREYEQRAENKARTLEDLHRLEHNRRALWKLIHGDLLPNPEQGMCQPHGWVNRLPDGFQYRMPPVVINGYQLRQALDFIAPDGLPEQLEETVCIAWRPAEDNLDGERCPAALCCWSAEYPEEGALPLAWAMPVALAQDLSGMSPIEQLEAFVAWERQQQPAKRHIAQWALERIQQLQHELEKLQAEPVAHEGTMGEFEEAAALIGRIYASDSRGEALAEILAYRKTVRERLQAEPVAQPMTQAARDVLAERQRQIEAEGYTAEHDDRHARSSLTRAAACYALTSNGWWPRGTTPALWPWETSDWKPSGDRRDLIKAGALILAEIERLDRADVTQSPKGGA